MLTSRDKCAVRPRKYNKAKTNISSSRIIILIFIFNLILKEKLHLMLRAIVIHMRIHVNVVHVKENLHSIASRFPQIHSVQSLKP